MTSVDQSCFAEAEAPAAQPSATGAPALPRDAQLVPIRNGALLLSRELALFCPVPAELVGPVSRALAGTLDQGELPRAFLDELVRHGFAGPAREPKPASRSVQLQLTNACNLECSYCCTNSGKPRAREVDRELMFRLVDDVREALGPGGRLAILGGEPLLVPWAVDLAEHSCELGLALTVFTNGTPLVDRALAKRVAALQRRGAEVRVSLAGPTKARCDQESGAQRFEQVLTGVRALADEGGRAKLDLMLLPADVGRVAASLHELRRLLPEGTPLSLGVLYLSGRERGEHLFPARAELEEALDRIAFGAGEVIGTAGRSPVAYRREGCSCALGHHLHVRSDGMLFTCFKMEEPVGHLDDLPFSETLARHHQRAYPALSLPLCAECPLATLCGGGCRSENLQYTGDADVPICGPWRVRVLCELLAEDRPSALEWPAQHLLAEARARDIEGPERLDPRVPSRHLLET